MEKQYEVPDDPAGRTADARIKDWQSPTGFWCAEIDPRTGEAILLMDADGDYIPAPSA